jgi:hypothetical protein
MHHAYEYYMNDVNANFKPDKLHEILSKMTRLPLSGDEITQGTESTIFNSNFTVKYCVLVSDVPIKYSHDSKMNDHKTEGTNGASSHRAHSSGIAMRSMRFFLNVMKYSDVEENRKNDSNLISLKTESSNFKLTHELENEVIKSMIEVAFDLDANSVQLAVKGYGFLKPKNIEQYNQFANSSNIIQHDQDENVMLVFFM